MTIPGVDLQPVVPSRGDKVKVILGDEDKDQSGQLLSIDSQVTKSFPFIIALPIV